MDIKTSQGFNFVLQKTWEYSNRTEMKMEAGSQRGNLSANAGRIARRTEDEGWVQGLEYNLGQRMIRICSKGTCRKKSE
jgi:hypothetical protein